MSRICPNCRSEVPADAPEGVCPACALRAGFGAESPTRATPSGGHEVPIEELARRLPELDAFSLLGRGGMGAVYRATHRRLQRPVAVKVIDLSLQSDPAFAERFEREARTMAQLDHPNIVRIYDFGHREGLYYLVMELVDGVNLRQTIEAGDLLPEEALAVVPKICEALQYAHDQGVVHRDIKPENILVDLDGTIKIADFGLAKLSKEYDRRLTGTRQVMGTPHYMAPEQIEKPSEVDHRADIFALGVVFYELLTGELPVGRFPPPSEKVQVDVRLDEVVLRTLEKEPGLRYQQASQLGTEVQAINDSDADGESIPFKRIGAMLPMPGTGPYEFKTEATFMGVPLVHINFSRDASGMRMRVANGIIAIGDIALGTVAVGGFAFGGICFGGISVGLISFAGLSVGLISAVGGFAMGGFALGGLAAGLIATGGATLQLLSPDAGGSSIGKSVGIASSAIGVLAGSFCSVYAWWKSVRRSD